MRKRRKGFKYSKKLLYTLYHMRAFQPGDQILLTSNPKADLGIKNLGRALLVHSMDDDDQWPLNLVTKRNKENIGQQGGWDECAKLEDIVAWRPRAHNT